jgi:predicted nucleic acid-binding protein
LTKVFVDTGAFVAVRRSDEREHRQARETLLALVERGAQLISTNYTFAETYTTLLSRVGRRAAIAWGSEARSTSRFEFVRVDEELEDAAWQILEMHEDKSWSYVDAVSFALMERDGISTAFAFDDHFRQRGLAVVPGLG